MLNDQGPLAEKIILAMADGRERTAQDLSYRLKMDSSHFAHTLGQLRNLGLLVSDKGPHNITIWRKAEATQ